MGIIDYRSPPGQKDKEHHDRDHELLLSPGVNYRRLQRNIRDTNTAATAGPGWAGLGWDLFPRTE